MHMSRFAIREATLADAEGIARSHTLSWQTSYRGILPDSVLDLIDVGQRASSRRQILRDDSIFKLVAFDVTHGEIYAIYLEHHAKRHGLGVEMFERTTAWLRAKQMASLVIWVLDNNHHARR